MKILGLFIISIHLFSAESQFKHCAGLGMEDRHKLAVSKLQQSLKFFKSNQMNELEEGLKRYFNVDFHSETRKYIKKVLLNIKKVAKKAAQTKYKCHKRKKSAYCMGKVAAIVPPPKTRVHLCPIFFNDMSEKEKVATLIHEMFHRWGGDKIDYLLESYCKNIDLTDTSKLIRTADQYMLFLYNLNNRDDGIDCF